MKIKLQLGGVAFCIVAERDLLINPELAAFLKEQQHESDITIEISWNWENARQPVTEPIGQDLIQNYYIEGNDCYCITRAGQKGPIASTLYTSDFSKVVCTLNEKPFLEPPKTLGSILRMLPMRQIFLYFHTLFLHASQISYGGKGILFAAPSGIGKTTQAKLWKKHRGAEIVCNDRTLLRKVEKKWYTYGYPLDGSEPVCSSQVNQLGCVVLLKQGPVNQIRQLETGKNIGLLMGQVVMDCWSSDARTKTMEQIITLLRDIPVYLLTCTPDERAVKTLEAKLIEREVISHGENFRPSLEEGG